MDARRDERFPSNLAIKLDRGAGVMHNVSASGLYFETDADLKPGERFSFTLEFSGEQIGVISAQCEAHVVRVEPRGTSTVVGAEFDSIRFNRVP